jgi:FAD/FMN-containing dehydrogenase
VLTLLAVTALLAAVLAFWPKIAELWYKRDEKLIYDFTRLDPTRVGAYILPRDTQDISDALGRHTGKVCVGGGRFSMGGQVAYPDALHIDMRGMNKLLSFDKVRGIVTVQAGMTWRELQRQIAPYWAVKIMQSYNAFTVGGSLNVNVHGRYIGEGPLVLSVLSFKLVQADGSVLHCSRYDNHEIFKAVPGHQGSANRAIPVTR